MPYQPANPFPKARGDAIRSQDWNDAVLEVQRLDAAKVNRTGDAITGSLNVSGNLGVGTTSPGAKLHVAGGSIRWGNNSELVADQGGSIELGGNNTTAGTGMPYIDFHFSGQTQDFNTRITNDANGRLSLIASTLQATGNVGVGTASPQRALSVNAAFNVDQANANNGAVNPGITFGSNSGEGIASKRTAGGNQAGLDLYTNNAARLSITSGGNVGIGTAAPGARLDISGSGGAVQCCAPVAPTLSLAEASNTAGRQSWLQFHNVNEAEAYIRLAGGGPSGSGREGQRRIEIGDTQTASANLTVQGRVGVGTTTPAERLHVEGGNIQVRQFPANDTTPSLTSLQLVNRGTGGNTLYWSLYTAAVGGGFGVNPNSFEIWEYPATSSRFQIRPGGNTVLVPAGGNVGIGTPSPGAKLQVSGGAIMPATGNSATAGIQFPSNPGGGGGDEAFIRYFVESGETTKLLIGCQNDADDRIGFYQFGAERLTIYNGNVGIGTGEPTHRFHVVAPDAVGLFESSGGQAYLRLSTNEGIDNRVEITNRPGGRLSLWTAGGGDVFNVARGGNVGVGVINPEARLHVAGGDIRLEANRTFYSPGRMHIHGEEILYLLNLQGVIISKAWNGNGNLVVEGQAWKPGGGGFNNTSDIRLKKGVQPLRGALNKLLQLRGVSFEWKKPEEQGDLTGPQIGLVAQEVEEVLPEWVEIDPRGYKGLAIRGFEALAVEAFKELKTENDALKMKTQELEDRVQVLEASVPASAEDRKTTGVGKLAATPEAERRARELGVRLSDMKGTGSGGRILVEDVERAAKG